MRRRPCPSAKSRVADLEREFVLSQERIETLNQELASTQLPAVSSGPPSGATGSGLYNKIPGGDLLPPAEPSQCYARVFVPPTYETRTEQILKRGESESLEVIPATYETVEEPVLVEAASSESK